MFVCLGCHNRTPQTGWLEQHKSIFSQFWSLEPQAQGTSRVCCSQGLSLGLVGGCLPAVPSHGLSCVQAHPWCPFPFLHWMEATSLSPCLILIPFFKDPPPKTLLPCGLGLEHFQRTQLVRNQWRGGGQQCGSGCTQPGLSPRVLPKCLSVSVSVLSSPAWAAHNSSRGPGPSAPTRSLCPWWPLSPFPSILQAEDRPGKRISRCSHHKLSGCETVFLSPILRFSSHVLLL